MNILAGLPIGIKIVGGIVTVATAVSVPTAIIINNSDANKPPETPQDHMVQQTKPEKPTEEFTIIGNDNEEESKATTEPVKAEPLSPVKTEQPAPNPTPAPAPTREELFARAVAEFKTTKLFDNDNTNGKDFLDEMRGGYLSIVNDESNIEYAKRRFEHLYTTNMMMPVSMKFAKILRNHELFSIDSSLYQMNQTAYQYLIDLAINGNY